MGIGNMKMWDTNKDKHGGFVESPEVEAFLGDLVEVYKKHNMSLSHEDGHGAFLIENFDIDNINWLRNAHINRRK